MTADHVDDMQRAHVTDLPTDGTLVGNRYRLGEVLGQGGFGVVYTAADELLRRRVAVKEVRFPPGTTETDRTILVERVMREARSAARLHHPGVVAVLDVIDDGGRPWIVMELVESRSLSAVISEDGPLSPAAAAKIGVSVAYALEAAHRAGVVHRDVKPGNVLITPDSGARLTDFGIALTADDPKLTRTGMLVGSPAYIAPERARGGAGGAASDVWGLGATLYAAVEGAPPFDSENAIATLTAVVEGRRRPFQLAGPLAPLIDELMAVDETTRPALSTARRRLREISDPDVTRRGLSSRRVSRTRSAVWQNAPQDAATTLVVPNSGRGRGFSGARDGGTASGKQPAPASPPAAAAGAAAAAAAAAGARAVPCLGLPSQARRPPRFGTGTGTGRTGGATNLSGAGRPAAPGLTEATTATEAATEGLNPLFATAASPPEPPEPAEPSPVVARPPTTSPSARATLAAAFRRHPGDPRGVPPVFTQPEPAAAPPPPAEPTPSTAASRVPP